VYSPTSTTEEGHLDSRAPGRAIGFLLALGNDRSYDKPAVLFNTTEERRNPENNLEGDELRYLPIRTGGGGDLLTRTLSTLRDRRQMGTDFSGKTWQGKGGGRPICGEQ